jgi:predicted Zn-dependent protease
MQPTALGSDLKFDWNEDLSTLRPSIDDEDIEPMDQSVSSTTKQQVLTTNNSHRTQEEFEELVKQAPNDSHLWIEYMQFYIDQAEIDRARSLAERALGSIYYR